MSVYQSWQEEKDIAKEKLEEAEEHLRNALKEAQDSPEPPTEDFKRQLKISSIDILEILGRL